MRIHQGIPRKVRGGWAVSIREPTRVTEMGETVVDGRVEAGDYVEVETRRGKKWLARIDNIGSSRGGIATVFTERLSEEEQQAVRDQLNQHTSAPTPPASPAAWDSLPADIQNRVVLTAANDRAYQNALQNSDAQNAGVELETALERAMRDEGMALIRSRPVSDADRDAHNALSRAAAGLKQDPQLRDRLAAQVKEVAVPVSDMSDQALRDALATLEASERDYDPTSLTASKLREGAMVYREEIERRAGAEPSPTGRYITANLDPAGDTISAIVPKDDVQPQAGDWVNVSLPVTISRDRTTRSGGGRQKYELTSGTADVGESGNFRTYRWQLADLIPREYTPPRGQGAPEPDTAALLAQAEQDPDYRSAMARGLMDRLTPEERAALDRKFALSKQLQQERYEADFPTSEHQALIDEMRELGVDEHLIGLYENPAGGRYSGNPAHDRERMQQVINRERAEQAALPATAAPPHVAAEIARGIDQRARIYENEAEIEAEARERMPADQRYVKKPGLRKAEREQLDRLSEEVVALQARITQLVSEHRISDEDLETLRDYAIPFGRDIQDPHLRAKWRNEFYDVAPYEGVREATKRANAEIARYQAQGGLEAEERQQREKEEARERRVADNRAKSEQKIDWIRQKIAAGETVGIYAMTYTGGLAGMKPSGPEITPQLYAEWQASGQDLFKIGQEGDLLVATGRKRDPYHATTFSSLVASDGQRFSGTEPAPAPEMTEGREQTEPPPVAETCSGTSDAEPPEVRLWVGRALTQGGIPVILTARVAEPGDEAQFVLSGQDLFQDLGDVYTSVVPLEDVTPIDGLPIGAKPADLLLLDKSPVLVTPGVISDGAAVMFPRGDGWVNYGNVQEGPRGRRTFRVDKPRRRSRAKAGRIASAR